MRYKKSRTRGNSLTPFQSSIHGHGECYVQQWTEKEKGRNVLFCYLPPRLREAPEIKEELRLRNMNK